MSQWGSNTSDESKPNWIWLTAQKGAAEPKSANVFATASGWVHRWPWGDEVLVAIGNLDANLGVANLVALFAQSLGEVSNSAAQSLKLLVEFNEPVEVTGTPSISAIQAASGVANVTLTYSSADSDPAAGKLVFANTGLDLGAANVTGTFTVNATSVLVGFNGITDAHANVVANAIGAGITAVYTIVSELPIQTVDLAGNDLANATNQVLSFSLGFNRPVVVTGTPTVDAIGLFANSDPYANVTLSYDAASSNSTTLVFTSAPQDFSALTVNATFAVNASSTLVGFDGIADVSGNVAANTITTANTQNVTAA